MPRTRAVPSSLAYAPYAIGVFMLTPFVVWFGLWAFAFPGPKVGFDSPLSLALLVVSLPLAAWHFVLGLGFVSNSMAGADPEAAPVARMARWVIAVLPWLSLALGLASVPYLMTMGEPLWAVPIPLLTALLLASVKWIAQRGPQPDRDVAKVSVLRQAGRAFLRVPVLGGMVREIITQGERAAPLVILNGVLALALSAALFGPAAIMVAAMGMVVVMFLVFLAFGAS